MYSTNKYFMIYRYIHGKSTMHMSLHELNLIHLEFLFSVAHKASLLV